MFVPRPEQQLGGTKTAGRDKHTVSKHVAAHERTRDDAIELDTITASARFDATYHVERSHHATVLLRGCEIGEVQPVLRANLAPDVAVAEMDASALLLSLRVDERSRVPAVEAFTFPDPPPVLCAAWVKRAGPVESGGGRA